MGTPQRHPREHPRRAAAARPAGSVDPVNAPRRSPNFTRFIGTGALLAFVFALVQFGPDWGDVVSQVTHPSIAPDENVFTYAYFAIGLFGAAMTPYEVFFFSSGAVEEGWTRHDLALNRANVYVGFPLGGVLSLAIMAMAALVLAPLHIGVDTLPQVALPVAATTGKVALAAVILRTSAP